MPGLLRTMEVKDLETGCFSGNGQLIGNKHKMVVINEGPGRNRRQQRSRVNNDVCGHSDQKESFPMCCKSLDGFTNMLRCE